MLRAEVADADRPHPAVGQQLLGRPVRCHGRVEVCGHRPVEEVEVHVVEPELLTALLEGAQCLLVAVIADPQLGRDEQLIPVDAAAADALADLPLVEVGRRRVDKPVPAGDRDLDGTRGLFRGL